MIKKIFASSIFFLIFAFIFSTATRAEQVVLSITGNSGSSDNTVNVNVDTSTTVQQSNDAQIINDVNSNSNTGENQVSSNTGDANIQTGSANNTTNVNNQNINQNIAENNACGCDLGVTASIDGNGSYSDNSINLSILNNTDVVQVNSANILNNIGVQANTGDNVANYNNGNVSIQTGNITALTNVKNKNINQSIDSQTNRNNLISVLISGNGSYSINEISLAFNNVLNFESRNIAEIINNVIVDANTGRNIANNNNGSVLIATGDIVSVVNIGNENINSSFVSVDNCNCSSTPPGDGDGDGETPPVGGNPGTTPSSSSGGSGSSVGGAAGQVLGAAIGAVLPATGNYLMLLMTLLSIIMFAAGWYLRFGSDPSPPAYATL